MKPITTIFEKKTMKMIDALPPELRKKMLTELTNNMCISLSKALSRYMECSNCPLHVICSTNFIPVCGTLFYNYLKDDFKDDTNG